MPVGRVVVAARVAGQRLKAGRGVVAGVVVKQRVKTVCGVIASGAIKKECGETIRRVAKAARVGKECLKTGGSGCRCRYC